MVLPGSLLLRCATLLAELLDDYDALAMLMADALDMSLDRIAPSTLRLPVVAFRAVKYADKRNPGSNVLSLITTLRGDFSDNPDLAEIEDTIRRYASGPSGASPVTVQPPPNFAFTGRDKHLDQIHARFRAGKRVALVGMPGIGKTEVAREFAERYQAEYQAVFWVNAGTRDSLLASFGLIAGKLKLRNHDQPDKKAVLASVLDWLQSHSGWLLILDNADDLIMVMDVLSQGDDKTQDFFPAARQGHLMITSQRAFARNLASLVRIERMPPEEGALFLLRRSSILQEHQSLTEASESDRKAASALSEELGGLPLALDQAGAYMVSKGKSVQQYHNLYRLQQQKLHDQQGGRHASVTVTFRLAFQRLNSVSPAAADLMRLCAFLEPNEIPEEIFYDADSNCADADCLKAKDCVLGNRLRHAVTDEIGWDNTVGTGIDLAFMWRNSATRTLTTHRVVQAVLRHEMPKQMRRLWTQRAVLALRSAFPPVEYENWRKCDRLVPHAIACAEYAKDEDSVLQARAELLHEVAYFLSERGLYSQAEPLYKQAQTIFETTFVTDNPERLARCLHNLGWLYYKEWSHDRKEELAKNARLCYRKALRLWKSCHSKEHHEFAWCLSTLAELVLEQGRYGSAYLLYRRSVVIYEKLWDSLMKTQPEKYCNIAFSLAGLAEVCSRRAEFMKKDELFISSQFAEAEEHLRRALKIRQKHWPAEHPQLASSRIGMATLWRRRGNYEEAASEYQQGLKLLEVALGEDHPDVSWHRYRLLDLYREQGRDQEAESLYVKILTVSLQNLEAEQQAFLAKSGALYEPHDLTPK